MSSTLQYKRTARTAPAPRVTSRRIPPAVRCAAARSCAKGAGAEPHQPISLSRRQLGYAAAGVTLLNVPQDAFALGAPGLAKPDADGLSAYTRPEVKKGNHGIGWGSIDPYGFKVPAGWDEVGAFAGEGYGSQEVDLRFESTTGGRLEVTLAPIRRFIDPVPPNVTINAIGSPMKVIQAFGPEITGGSPISPEDVLSSEIKTGAKGRPYYVYDLKVAEKGNLLVVATVLRDRAYLMTMKSTNSLAWRKNKDDMRAIRFSTPFFVRAVSRRDIAHGTDSGTAGMGSGRIGFPRRDSFTVFD